MRISLEINNKFKKNQEIGVSFLDPLVKYNCFLVLILCYYSTFNNLINFCQDPIKFLGNLSFHIFPTLRSYFQGIYSITLLIICINLFHNDATHFFHRIQIWHIKSIFLASNHAFFCFGFHALLSYSISYSEGFFKKFLIRCSDLLSLQQNSRIDSFSS